jgi:hypothetical protein
MTWQFTGTMFGLGLLATDGVNSPFGAATLTVDGETIDMIDEAKWYDNRTDNTNLNRIGPLGRIYTGFTDELHEVTLTNAIAGNFVVDYFCTLLPRATMPTVMLNEISFQSAAGYATYATGGLNNDDYTQQANDLIRRIVNNLSDQGFPILLGQTSNYITDPVTQTEDGLHWIVPDAHTIAANGFLSDISANSAKYQKLPASARRDLIREVDASPVGTNAATAAEEIVATRKVVEADVVLELDAGVYVQKTLERGTATELIPDKVIKQPSGTDLTNPATQRFGGAAQEPV